MTQPPAGCGHGRPVHLVGTDHGGLRLAPRHILFSSLLYSGQAADWWYFTDNGQHVAFYTRRSLEFIARHYGYRLASNGCDPHLFTRERMSDRLLDACRKPREKLARRYRQRHGSRISADFEWVARRLDYRDSSCAAASSTSQ